MADSITPDSGTNTDALWSAAGLGMAGLAAWTHRGRAWEGGLPYGLTAGVPSPFHPDPLDPTYEVIRQLPPYHVTPLGWIGAGVAAATLVGLLACLHAAIAWTRWRRTGGTLAIPRIPVWGLAAVVGGITWIAALLLSRQPVAATAAAGGLAVALLVVGRPRAAGYRATQAWRGVAESVLGHGHPGIARVTTKGWQRRGGRSWPTTITATTGPGWRHMPGEVAELDRLTRAVGWPTYTWERDLMRRRIVGNTTTGE
jgi:hypothetical protein